MKVIKTNWINIVGVFLITFMYVAISACLHSATFAQAIFGAILSICLYGMMFWALFIILLVVIDLLLIVKNQTSLTLKLLIEWVIISSPFIYWAIRYREGIFVAAIIAFLITQFIRRNRIEVISKYNSKV